MTIIPQVSSFLVWHDLSDSVINGITTKGGTISINGLSMYNTITGNNTFGVGFDGFTDNSDGFPNDLYDLGTGPTGLGLNR